MTPINLQSVMIGNGLTDVLTAIPTYYDQACTNISGAPTGPVLDIHTCANMQSYVSLSVLPDVSHEAYRGINRRFPLARNGSRNRA